MPSRVGPTWEADTHPCPVLVLGLGNVLLRDEGVGVRVVEAMKGMDLPPGVEVFDGATAGLDLLEVLAGRRKVIVIDAIDGDCEPGTVLRLTPEDLVPQGTGGVSLHEIGLAEVVRAAAWLGVAPQDVVVLGVKPRHVTCGLELSTTLAGLIPKIIGLVMAELEA